ncbi:MAG TPA: site-specific integrase [Cyclobacteriaceae bacterium]|nr:site-specific integrase [Cyclobacteriaceae bacterium]
MFNGIKTLFYVRKTKVNSEGMVPIYFRATMGGQRFETTTTRYVELSKWSQQFERVVSHAKDKRSNEINVYLDMLKARVWSIEKKFLMMDSTPTIENFQAEWFGIEESAPKMLMQVFAEHNSEVKQLVGNQYSSSTWKRYNTSYRHTKEFLKAKYNLEDIPVRKLDFKFITDYEFWLKVTRKCNHNSTIKYLTNFRKMIYICLRNNWLDRDPFIGFKMAKKEVERPFLSEEELQSMAKHKFEIDRLNQVRDIFLFCCYTGLAYIDIQKLTPDEIVTGIDREKWIFTRREKTETPSRIPLLPPALEIIERYKNHPECIIKNKVLPVPSNQKMNGYLKEIADVCGIKKYLTTHLARHTFATTVTLTNGVPMETVSKMLGHKNLRTTQHYAKILDLKVGADMKVLKERMRLENEIKSKVNQ